MIRFVPLQNTKTFHVAEKTAVRNEKGRVTYQLVETEKYFCGSIATASPRQIEQYRQIGVEITHVIIVRGTVPVERNDVITFEGRTLQVEDVKNLAEAGIFSGVYCKEDNKDGDRKS